MLTLCDYFTTSSKSIETQKGNGYKSVCLKDKLIICNDENEWFVLEVLMICWEINEDFAFKMSEVFDMELPKQLSNSDKASS